MDILVQTYPKQIWKKIAAYVEEEIFYEIIKTSTNSYWNNINKNMINNTKINKNLKYLHSILLCVLFTDTSFY